jgi:FkbH-like protein
VSAALPQVHTVLFPRKANGLPALMTDLSRFFHREQVTSEDRDRTDMYRRMLEGLVPRDVDGADLTSFLADLVMRLEIHDRTEGDRTRAVQLINKTNQFNLNGIRRSAEEVDEMLAGGGKLFAASLADRHGAHGEILACLIDGDGVIRSLVLSCRVFQRRVEHAFLVWLSRILPPTVRLDFVQTPRNEPIRQFLSDPAFKSDEEACFLDFETFAVAHGDVEKLFQGDAG